MPAYDIEDKVEWIVKKLQETPALNGDFGELRKDVNSLVTNTAVLATEQAGIRKDMAAAMEELKSERSHRIKNGQRITRVEEKVESNRDRIISNAKLIVMLLGSGLSGGGIVAGISALVRGG